MFDIGIDMDGVVYDFGQSFRKYVIDQGIRTDEQCSRVLQMNFYQNWLDDNGKGISDTEFKEICHAGTDAGVIFLYGGPFPDARKALTDLKTMGNNVHIITDRTFGKDNHSEYLTQRWLEEYHIPYDTITFSANKASKYTDLMIDDKIENYDQLEEAGCYPYLYDRPWNQQPRDGRRRVQSLAEFVEAVQWHMFSEQEAYSFNRNGESQWI